MNLMLATKLDQILDVKSENSLTSNEINVYLRLFKMQNKDNYIQGVYWREIVDYLNISKSGYYYSITELERKGYIERVKLNRMDTDIIVKDHDLKTLLTNLKNKTNHEKYINLNMNVFNDKEFYKLKANEKRLILLLIKRLTGQNEGKLSYNPGNEFEVYAKELGVDKLPEGVDEKNNPYRCIKKYFNNIRKWIHVSDDIIINGKVKHIVTLLKNTTKLPKRLFTQSRGLKETNIYAEYDCQEHILKTFLRRNKIQYDDQNLADTTWLIRQYKNRFKRTTEDIYTYIKSAIFTSLEETVELTSQVVHKILINIANRVNVMASEETSNVNSEQPKNSNIKERKVNNRFNNFAQRDYDYDKLEKILLSGSKEEAEDLFPDVDFDNLIKE
ncbi:MAG: MarR family transcriptional regulator [Candidatus Galacturonibacter soehngenii]|nr:MarR family transcriptional regulator [Candidatus Galacturonibacter soehngenii]